MKFLAMTLASLSLFASSIAMADPTKIELMCFP